MRFELTRRAKITLGLLCFPVTCVILIVGAVESVKERIKEIQLHREYKKHALPMLPTSRKRALTLPLPEHGFQFGITRKQRTSNQQQSLLLTKLPVEIQRMIWEFVLSGNEIKIEPWHPNSQPDPRPKNWWALVKTCRQVYSQSIDLLYSITRFTVIRGFSGHNKLLHFQSSVLSHRWARIRVLHVKWGFYAVVTWSRQGCVVTPLPTGEIDGEKEWYAACKCLETLPSLSELRIEIDDRNGCCNVEKLEPLQNVRAKRVFEVVVPWGVTSDEISLVERGVPFTIIRKEADKTSGEALQ